MGLRYLKKEVTLNEKEIKHIFKEYFGLKEEPIVFFTGGMLNPLKVTLIYFESNNK